MVKTTNFFNDVTRLLSWGLKKRSEQRESGKVSKFFSWLYNHMKRE